MAKEPQKIIKCPVCGCKIWSHALKIHITNSGKSELFRWSNYVMGTPEDERSMSDINVFTNCPHYEFRKQHLISKLIFRI